VHWLGASKKAILTLWHWSRLRLLTAVPSETGNRRFRFLIAFNLERFRNSKNGITKSLVVQSLVRQIRQAGGRFLENHDPHQEMWIQVSDKVMRGKVSHALRDKHFHANLEFAKTIMCSIHLRTGDRQRIDGDDNFVAVVNERLLRVELPDERKCASGSNVECILTHEIASFALLSRGLLTPSSTAELTVDLTGPQREVAFYPPPDVLMSKRRDRDGDDGSVDENCFEECFDQILVPEQKILHDNRIPEKVSTILKQNSGWCTKQQNQNPLLGGGDVALHSGIDIGDYNLLHPQESVDYWDNNADDLPPSFTAEDCEDLLATLDFA
jgi:hypothetical protein